MWSSLYFPELGSLRGTICKFYFLVNCYLQMHTGSGANKKNCCYWLSTPPLPAAHLPNFLNTICVWSWHRLFSKTSSLLGSKLFPNMTENKATLQGLCINRFIVFIYKCQMRHTQTRQKRTCEIWSYQMVYRLWMMVLFLRLWTYSLAWSKLVFSTVLGGEPSTSLTK